MNRFHAHIYFDSRKLSEVSLAGQLRERLAGRFNAEVGTVYQHAVGPHPKPMFQVQFARHDFGDIVTWLMKERGPLSVLIHGVTGSDLQDHTQHSLWLGTPLDLKLEAFYEKSALKQPVKPGLSEIRVGQKG